MVHRRPGPPTGRRPVERRRRRTTRLVLVGALVVGGWLAVHRLRTGAPLSPLRARIVALADAQVGYRTSPADSYCNRFSAYWDAGTDCGDDGDRAEEWCADFAAWVWAQAGAAVTYALTPGDLNAASASFYAWGVRQRTWHPVGSGYTPQPGDVAVYGLDTATVQATHVAVVVAATGDPAAPDVVNGDGDRTGFSVVEVGHRQADADVPGRAGALSGYVSPSTRATTAS
ncbi:MAG TPA: CHAP domain-containing protein [Acidimicrobiales bacterium]|nr:CHAP domain-containing protein [Acidimicrobiales bacterium]